MGAPLHTSDPSSLQESANMQKCAHNIFLYLLNLI